jgi:lipopolysaccharide transport system ATP-binding protein
MDQLMHLSRGIVLASHSPALIKSMCNKVLILDGGDQVYFGDVAGWDFEGRHVKSQVMS